MKNTFLYLLLFSYTTIICKPILPLVSDCMAHVFWYSQHMATVHYEHGKYHVHYELMDTAKKGLPEKDANLSRSETNTEHLIVDNTYTFPPPVFIQTDFTSAASYLLHTHASSDFPPPRA
jgi:hypothetical protein